jgi:hypothetical protein
VLLAYQPESVIASIMAQTGLSRYTETTITDLGHLQQELELIRQQGYAVDNGEQEEGVRCLAAPVYGLKGRVVAAVSVSGPSSRLDSGHIPTLLPHLKHISAIISSVLATSQEKGNGITSRIQEPSHAPSNVWSYDRHGGFTAATALQGCDSSTESAGIAEYTAE